MWSIILENSMVPSAHVQRVYPHMRTTSLCKNKRSEICFFRHFCIWGSPYANFLCAKCVQIPMCESPYANKYCSITPKMNFLCIWDLRTHNEVVRIWGLTSTLYDRQRVMSEGACCWACLWGGGVGGFQTGFSSCAPSQCSSVKNCQVPSKLLLQQLASNLLTKKVQLLPDTQ